MAMACVGGWWAGAQPGMEHVRRLIAVLAACSILCVFVFFRPGWLAGLWQRLPQRLESWKIARVARDWIASSLEYRKRPGLLLAAFALSLAVQLARVMVFYVVAAGFGLHAPIIYYFVFIPLIMVLIMLPVSFNGIGVREVSFVGFFSMAGMPESGAFVVSLAVSVLTTLTTAVGGVIYMFDRGHSVPPPSGLDAPPDDSR